MGKTKRLISAGCDMDMTPMIDVTFQLIIFFVVTYKMTEASNKDVILDLAPHGPEIKAEDKDPRTITIEIDKRGWITIHNAKCTLQQLHDIMKSKYVRFGEYPVMIRADKRTLHKDVKKVMDVCTSVGLWKINFAAIKEKKSKD
jgi:biopolymer transport protein ExbD